MAETMYERIQRLRKMQGMSQDDLAKKVGYSDKSMVSRIESGKVDISGKTIISFATALGVTPDYLFDGVSGFISKNANPHVTLTPDEFRLVRAYRAAEPAARKIALQTLENNPLPKKEKEAT